MAEGLDEYYAVIAKWKANRDKKERLEEEWEEIDRKIGLLQIDLVEVNWKLREARKAHLELTGQVAEAAEAAFGVSTAGTSAPAGKVPALMLRFMR